MAHWRNGDNIRYDSKLCRNIGGSQQGFPGPGAVRRLQRLGGDAMSAPDGGIRSRIRVTASRDGRSRLFRLIGFDGTQHRADHAAPE